MTRLAADRPSRRRLHYPTAALGVLLLADAGAVWFATMYAGEAVLGWTA